MTARRAIAFAAGVLLAAAWLVALVALWPSVGPGGLHLALAQSNVRGTVVRAFDWDQVACRVYAANHGADIVRKVAQ